MSFQPLELEPIGRRRITAHDIVEITTRRCRHFTGLVHGKCAMHVKYSSVAGPELPNGQPALPCIGPASDAMAPRCKRRSTFTKHEAGIRVGRQEVTP
ncbi:MAG: hypothetical protein PHO55_15760 [Thiomonas arsenitoxydans]|jgi:hypothetical protein|nr:hypothetical protein [Thiomonas arsenitoxydans]